MKWVALTLPIELETQALRLNSPTNFEYYKYAGSLVNWFLGLIWICALECTWVCFSCTGRISRFALICTKADKIDARVLYARLWIYVADAGMYPWIYASFSNIELTADVIEVWMVLSNYLHRISKPSIWLRFFYKPWNIFCISMSEKKSSLD